jgi:hypothetical protein
MKTNKKFDLKTILKKKNKPLTDEQLKRWDRIMSLSNTDNSAQNVCIKNSVTIHIENIKTNGLFWNNYRNDK